MDHTLSQLQALLDEAERTQTSVSASWAGRLHALASQAARLGSGSFLAIEYRAIFPLLELPDSVVSLILSHLPAARLAACMHTCRAFQRHLGEAAISMRLTRLEQVLPTVQPGEAVTHALRFAEMLAASPPATLGAGESHTLCLGREGVLLSCGGDYLDDDQRWPFVGHLGHGQEWGEAVARPAAVRLPAGVRARAVAGGGYVSLCLSCAHEAWSWGGYGCGHGLDAGNVPRPKRLPLPLPAGGRVALLACGSQHCLLLDSEGQIWASGRNLHGELGVGDTQPRTRPSRLDALPSHTRFCALSAGGSHSLAVEAGGAVLSWGHGGAGRLGHGDEKPQHLPKRVDALVGAGAGYAPLRRDPPLNERASACLNDSHVFAPGQAAGGGWRHAQPLRGGRAAVQLRLQGRRQAGGAGRPPQRGRRRAQAAARSRRTGRHGRLQRPHRPRPRLRACAPRAAPDRVRRSPQRGAHRDAPVRHARLHVGQG
eukprot:Transcript_22787.p1 GENE.Transcript_22787~~Transcript_22787.p1  ORF type:complete len:511 (-),score=56.80 Transcript_22787:1064-2515(-)